jgi:MOSC domain-containing protein YiiM
MKSVDGATLVTGYGIEGDRHATREGARIGRQVLLMDSETLDSFNLSWGEIRENITTKGIDLVALEGQKVALGDEVVLRITEHCAPCARMDEIRDGLRVELNRKRGMLAYVVQGGKIKAGDTIRALEVTVSL